jgi:DNA polymerase I-like protein with 3'-5' exonuclease and polymerase domains
MIELFAIFFKLPFEREIYKIIRADNKITKGKNVNLPYADRIITINLWDYLSDSDKIYTFPNEIFDLATAERILTGKPKDYFLQNNEPWKGIQILGKNFDNHTVFGKIKSIEDNKYSTFAEWEKNLPLNWEVTLMDAFEKEYNTLVILLKQQGIYNSFLNIEMRLLSGFIKSSMNGITIDREKLNVRCLELDNIYYNSIRDLEITHGYFVNDSKPVTYENIKEYIKEFNKAEFSKKYFWDSVKLYQNVNNFIALLYTEYSTRRDLSELLRISVGISDSCKLQYDIMGTVSGRILLTRPGIQYLKRTSRDIFVPHKGNKFIYADYSQFEPGILSYLSNDSSLKIAYENGDIYFNLAEKIGNGCTRSVAKKMFLSYIYGMSIENIKKNIINTFGNSSGNSVSMFLNEFPSISKWKQSVVQESFADKIAVGLTGYVRYFSDDDYKEEIARWAPNHIIQSTASGIFKSALVNYLSETKGGKILVPMHDAILLEVSSENYEQEKNIIHKCMKETFETICHGMKCKIHFDNFSSD